MTKSEYKLICDVCKKKKLTQMNIKMTVGMGYSKIGKCSICNQENVYLYAYKEENSCVTNPSDESKQKK